MLLNINIFSHSSAKASELYDAMLQLKTQRATGRKGRETTDVGLRKQQRHLKYIR